MDRASGSAENEESVAALLLSWGLDAPTIQRFIDEDFSVNHLAFLTDETINRLLPKAGPRECFKFKWAEWKGSQPGQPEKDPVTPIKRASKRPAQKSSTSPVSWTKLSLKEDEPSINEVHERLKSTPEGHSVLAYYNLHGKLNDSFRDILSTRVVTGETKLDFDKRIGKARFEELAHQIVELFPLEAEHTWFELEEKKRRKIVSGRLKHKFYNNRRTYIDVALISKATLEAELDSDEDLLSDSELSDDNILWLKEHDSPWTDVLSKWNNSFQVRKLLFRRCSSIGAIITDFPALKKEIGHELLIEDFNADHPELVYHVDTHWPLFLNYVKNLIQEKDSDFLSEVDEESDSACVEILCHLASIFKPRTHKTTVVDTTQKKTKSKKQTKSKGTEKQATLVWRPSSQEVQESFLLRIDEIGKLKGVLKERNRVLVKYGFTLQPFVVLVGPAARIRQSIIVLDNLIWECPNPIQAVDSLFKIFFVLNCSYPVESRHLWLLIQQCVYNINTPNDYKGSVGLKSYLAAYVKEWKSVVNDS